MSHRLQHLHKRKFQQSQTQPESTNSYTQSPQKNYNKSVNNAKGGKASQGVRPIFPSTNVVKPFDKNDFRKGEMVFPPPQSLYTSRDTEIDPRFVRSSCAVLNNQFQKTAYPLAIWITPFATQQVHTVQVAAPLRCNRCKAYINPYFQFDGTRRSVACNLCGLRFVVPETIDRLNTSSTEIATQSIIDFRVSDKLYFKKRTDIIKIIVLVQLTMSMMEMGAFSSICQGIKSVFDSHQFNSAVRIAIAFYSDQGVGFIRLPHQQQQFNVFMVPQGKAGFGCCPLSQTQFFADPNTQKDSLLGAMQFLQKYSEAVWKLGRFSHSASYTFALRCAREAFQHETGKIFLFSALDPRSGLCAIRPRTEEEIRNPMKPIHLQAHEYAKQLLRARIGVEHFIFSKDTLVSHQLSTMHFISSSTGGKLYHYSHFNSQVDGTHLYYSIFHSFTKKSYYDVEFTCRSSNGLNVVRYGAPDGLRESRDVSLSTLDSTSSFTIQFQQEQKLEQNLGAFLQFATMYTTSSGQRKIRVINYKFQVKNRLAAIYESIDYLTFSNCLLRNYSLKLIRGADPNKCREDCINYIGAVVSQARSRVPTCNGSVGDMTVPSGMVWSFSYLSSVLNSKLFLSSLKTAPDLRIVEFLRIQQLNPYFFASRFYPKLYPLSLSIYDVQEGAPIPGDFIENEEEVEGDQENKIAILPQNLPLTMSSLRGNGIYLVDDGQELVILVYQQADQQSLNELFGTTDFTEIEANGLPQLQTSHNIRVNNIVNQLRRRSALNGGMYQPLSVKTSVKKGPFSEYLSTVLKQDNYDCPFGTFLDNVSRAMAISK